MNQRPIVVVFDPHSLASPGQVAALGAGPFSVMRTVDRDEAVGAIGLEGASVLLVVEGEVGPEDVAPLVGSARGRGIPVVGLGVRPGTAGHDFDARVDPDDDGPGLSARLARLAGIPGEAPTISDAIPIDTKLIGQIIHDIRNPLNVIGLTLRVMEQLPKTLRDELQEDLDFLRDNAHQIERMLVLLSDFCRVADNTAEPAPAPFDPARFVEEVTEERGTKTTEKGFPARVEADPSTPKSVRLDPVNVRLALRCALTNAAGASERPMTVRTSGDGDRWSITIVVDKPPPATVTPGPIVSGTYERLIATPAERKGLDIAMAAWLAGRLGGSVRVEVVPSERSTIVIDLPTDSG